MERAKFLYLKYLKVYYQETGQELVSIQDIHLLDGLVDQIDFHFKTAAELKKCLELLHLRLSVPLDQTLYSLPEFIQLKVEALKTQGDLIDPRAAHDDLRECGQVKTRKRGMTTNECPKLQKLNNLKKLMEFKPLNTIRSMEPNPNKAMMKQMLNISFETYLKVQARKNDQVIKQYSGICFVL